MTALAGAGWKVFTRLRKGARLKGRVTLDVFPRLVAAGDEEKAYMELEVRNVGDAPTTISSVVLMAYRRTWFGLRGGEEWNKTK